jgi:hypothetical protein
MFPNKPFRASAWFWRDSTGVIYSSAANALVSSTDASFVAWSTNGSLPTVWPRDSSGNQTAASLNAVLDAYGLPHYVPA